jgi:hypothetical protein
MVVNLRKGVKTSSKRIQRFMKKTGIHNVYSFALCKAKVQLDQAFSEYSKKARKEVNSWRLEFQDSLIAA